MSATQRGLVAPAQDLFVDSLESEITESLKDPQYRAAFEDSTQRHWLIDRLIRRRKERKLTQKQVAQRMGVGQSTVAGFENEGSDPRLSTVQRYARAVEARCVVSIQTSMQCDWIPAAPRYIQAGGTETLRVRRDAPSDKDLAWADVFGLAA